MQIQQRQDLTKNERKLLYRLKLAFWVIGVLFIVHALLGRSFIEVWPITRWAMFSYSRPAADTQRVLEIRAADTSCEVHIFSPGSLYAKSGYPVSSVAPSLVQLGINVKDPTQRLVYRELLASEIEKRFEIELAHLEVWAIDYDINTSEFPHIDYEHPSDKTMMMEFIVDSTIQCSAN